MRSRRSREIMDMRSIVCRPRFPIGTLQPVKYGGERPCRLWTIAHGVKLAACAGTGLMNGKIRSGVVEPAVEVAANGVEKSRVPGAAFLPASACPRGRCQMWLPRSRGCRQCHAAQRGLFHRSHRAAIQHGQRPGGRPCAGLRITPRNEPRSCAADRARGAAPASNAWSRPSAGRQALAKCRSWRFSTIRCRARHGT